MCDLNIDFLLTLWNKALGIHSSNFGPLTQTELANIQPHMSLDLTSTHERFSPQMCCRSHVDI